ncbi:MAG: hypothetical protein ABI680_10995 [Chthoniobacteraceae bacterium]
MSAASNPHSVPWQVIALYAVLGLAVLIWFVLMTRFFRILRIRHPKIYDQLGRPTLIKNNTIQNGIAWSRFLLGGRFRKLDDPGLTRLGSIMQVFFYVYLVMILTLFGLMIFAFASGPR